MVTIYYKPHIKRVREAAFFNFLKTHLPHATVIHQNFPIPSHYLSQTIDTHRLIKCLQIDQILPAKARSECIRILNNCPSQLKVALTPSQISFDMVVKAGTDIYYWEFHEEQHWKLTVPRPQKVYTADNKPLEIPRYLQRLIRDIWRLEHFPAYTIVWHDWFEENQVQYAPELLKSIEEFHLPGKFSFRQFWQLGK